MNISGNFTHTQQGLPIDLSNKSKGSLIQKRHVFEFEGAKDLDIKKGDILIFCGVKIKVTSFSDSHIEGISNDY